MNDVYKLTQKSVWTNNIGRHTTWYLLDEHKMGYYIDYIEWTVQRDWGFSGWIPSAWPSATTARRAA